MYNPRVIQQNIAAYLRNEGPRAKLRRYSVKEARHNADHLDSLITQDGKLDPVQRPHGLLHDEQAFIQNERVMCRLDFLYWAARYAFVKDRVSDTLVLFRPYRAQKIVLDIWARLEGRGLAIACICLKGRQLGISTLTELAVAHRVQFRRNVNAIIGSSDPGKSTEMSKMIETCWANQPWWLLPNTTVHKRGEQIEFGSMNSGVSVQHGSQFTGIGRGTTPSTVHLSETASFLNPEELIDASLLGAFHESPDRFMVLESTAEGNSGWWYDTWHQSLSLWPRTLLRPIFLPYFSGDDIYPTKTELLRNPIPDEPCPRCGGNGKDPEHEGACGECEGTGRIETWTPAPRTLKHKEAAELYARTQPDLKRYLGPGWKLSREKMWWWETERENYRRKGELNLFYQEYASNPEESFQSQNISAFDTDLISDLRDNALAVPPKAVFAIAGDLVSERMLENQSHRVTDDPVIPITVQWDRSLDPMKFELLPLQFLSYQEDPSDRLYVWEFPKENTRYVLGIDTADGVGQDRSIIEVIRLADPSNPEDICEQVAEFASPFVNSRDLWPVCAAIGTWYTTPIKGRFDQVRQVIECNGNGETVQYELQKRGWWNFHPWEHYDNKRPTRYNKIGWFTNFRTRQIAVDTLVSSLRDLWLVPRSPWFVDEMTSFERNEARQSLRAAAGKHDDRLMAGAIALASTYIHEITTNGRTFFAGRRKRRPQSEVVGVRPEQLTQELLKDMARPMNPYTSTGQYDPY